MRKARYKLLHAEVAVYHVVSRVVNRDFVLGDAEKAQFVRYMRMYEKYCGVQVLTYCVMSNHFHILVAVPKRPEAVPSDAELVQRVKDSIGEVSAQALEEELRVARASMTGEWAEAIRTRHLNRMWDISAFMKTLKQRFTQWFNKRHDRTGTLWEGRFRSVIVEGLGTPLVAMATYIDLNPVRAGIVDDPKDYRWCGYGAALGGKELAAKGLAKIVESMPVAETQGLKPLAGYRVLLFGRGIERGLTKEGKPMQRGFSLKQAKKVIDDGGKLDRFDYVRCKVRYFTDGAVIGSREFVNHIFETTRERYGPKRKDGARRMTGLSKDEGLFSMRDLRVAAVN